MTPRITVDLTLPVAPYEQIRAQLADLIQAGQLLSDERLPPVRQLATDLGLAAGTVARAYRELEQAGLLVSRRGGGTRVSTDLPDPPERHRHRLLRLRATEFVQHARRIGATDDDALAAVRDALRAAAPQRNLKPGTEEPDPS